MNPRAAINGLLPFQGSPFNRLGTSPSIKRLNFPSLLLKSQRRERDSNPRALSDKRFSRPPRYDHFDISPSSCLSLLLTGDLYILALLFFYVNTFFQIISFFCDWYFQVIFYPCFCRNSCPIRISSGVVIFIFV